MMSSLDSIRPPYVNPVDVALLSTPGASGSSRAYGDRTGAAAAVSAAQAALRRPLAEAVVCAAAGALQVM